MNEDDKNIINMAEARKRQQTLAKQKKANKRKAGSSNAANPTQVKDFKWWASGVLQVAIFLFLVYWLMDSCGGR